MTGACLDPPGGECSPCFLGLRCDVCGRAMVGDVTTDFYMGPYEDGEPWSC